MLRFNLSTQQKLKKSNEEDEKEKETKLTDNRTDRPKKLTRSILEKQKFN